MAKTEVKKNRSPRRKRRGLRFLISLIILIAAAGAVFWFGWVQFSLEEGQVGVVYTKSHGYEDEVLNSGDFAWRWQALLPTNLTVHAFDTETRSFIFNREGSLPSGDLYATMAGEGIDFNWSVKGQVSYRINPDSLPSLVADGLAGDNLDSYYTGFEARVEGEISRILANLAPGDTPESITAAMESMEAELLRQAENLDERIDVVEVTILDWVSPDMDLYVESRRLYLDFLTLRQAVLTEVENEAVRREDTQGARIDLLERYGRVLDTYPVLLQLFALEGNPGSALLPPRDLE